MSRYMCRPIQCLTCHSVFYQIFSRSFFTENDLTIYMITVMETEKKQIKVTPYCIDTHAYV